MKNFWRINLLLTAFSLLLIFVGYYKNISIHNKLSTSITVYHDNFPDKEKDYVIGWSVYNTEQEYFRTMQQGVLDRAAELGFTVIPYDQKSKTSEMISGTIDLISKGIDALIISPINPAAMVIVSQLTHEAGIPLVVIDLGTGGADVDAFIYSDNYGGGVLAAEYALRLIQEHNLKSHNVAIIKVEETSNATRRGDAFSKVMENHGYEVVAEITANSNEEQAYEAMKEILEVYGSDLAVVFAENDTMALGVARAVNEAGLTGQIMIIGFNGESFAIDAIKNGYMQGTIAQKPYEMGELGVDIVDQLLKGQEIMYDDRDTKELYSEIYLIDETGTRSR